MTVASTEVGEDGRGGLVVCGFEGNAPDAFDTPATLSVRYWDRGSAPYDSCCSARTIMGKEMSG